MSEPSTCCPNSAVAPATTLRPPSSASVYVCSFFQAEDGIRDLTVTGVQTCALPIWLNYLGEVLLARDWEPREKLVLENALMKFQSAYAKEPSRAEEVLKVGESSRDSGIRPDELASWMLVASAAMNLDAVLNK